MQNTPKRNSRSLPTVAFLALMTVACNPVPIDNLERTFSMKVETSAGTDQQVKIDFLWVIDNSTSMCEEQVALAASFQTFTQKLSTFFAIDARLAVTTADAQCDLDPEAKINASKGVFNNVPASRFPAACYFKDQVECSSDDDCGAAGEWSCAVEQLDTCIVNPNGSVNTSCRRLCNSDADCAAQFGDPSFECLQPGGSGDTGCLKQPDTQACPANLPSVLTSVDNNIEDFACLATVGVYSSKCFKYEQGLRTAFTAIDVNGQNSEQAKNFLREDAYLVIIIVSDEDDCSTVDGQTFHEDLYNTCAFEKTTDEGGILVPVRNYVNRFKSLKKDPSRVIVAAIAGDALVEDTSDKLVPACASLLPSDPTNSTAQQQAQYLACAREEFRASKTNPKICHQKTYACRGAGGIADWGSRYQELTQGFGNNGLFLNICSESGISSALDDIAEKIVEVVNKVCLPRRVLDADSLEVIKTLADGVTKVTLVEGDETDVGYTLEPEVADCAVDGVFMPALTFKKAPAPGENISITYKGDPLFDGVAAAE